jgi:uncharacterized coiled-coil protein SlyX
MTESVKVWIKENYFLGGVVMAIFSITAYMVTLETRVNTLEIRGSPHLEEINRRLTVTEKETEANKASLALIREVLTRELGKQPPAR